MSKFHALPVARVDAETRDAIAVTFDVPDRLREAFRFEPGQHLTLRADLGGEDLRRSYSICAPAGGALRIAIKRAPGGAFSTWANDTLRRGSVVEVMPPLGHFNAPAEPAGDRHHVAVAAGSGITPILSIIGTALEREPRTRFTLVYGNRASSSVMFREELAALKDRFMTRLQLLHVLSREPQDLDVLNGRIDRAKADALFSTLVPLDRIDCAFLCGPEGMMDAVRDALSARGFPASRIRIERFAASIPRHMHVARPLPQASRGECEVTVIIDGSRRQFLLEKGKENIIDAGIRSGVELPYSCKGGVCSTCRCRLVAGEVDMDVNFALEDYEVARGFRLACQSYPVTDSVTVDFDQTGTG
ncbi:MAG: phenylacetate-CoA oxygenase/reductase subunit PaaK [Proteobacteria bacterium]|jgi:ring-1,2-phenylacetyl-CoA epoxidase subunit PaaE|nr:phenylacetate-CoA oxygenase/reductase subunit PaaK [Pseudomonadota bacterium]